MQSIICRNPLQFTQSLLEASSLSMSEKKPLLIAFLGEKVSSTDKSWCPDCVAAEPIIQTSLQSMIPGCVYLECIVKREEYKGNPQYVYRQLPGIELKCVPTLIHWKGDQCVARLDDSQCQVKSTVEGFIRKVVP
eukprot:gene36273-47206_t